MGMGEKNSVIYLIYGPEKKLVPLIISTQKTQPNYLHQLRISQKTFQEKSERLSKNKNTRTKKRNIAFTHLFRWN